MIRAYAGSMTTDFGMCFARLDDRELGEEPRAQVRRSKRRYDLAFRKQIERGVEDGSVKPCNPKLAAFVIAGALNGIADWYRPGGDLSVETIADEFALRLTEGLATRANQLPATAKPRSRRKAKIMSLGRSSKVGMEAQDTSELFFDDVRVPTSNLLGAEEGLGFVQLMQQLPQERLTIGIIGVVAMERASNERGNAPALDLVGRPRSRLFGAGAPTLSFLRAKGILF